MLTVDRQAPIKNALLIPQRAMALDANGNANVLKRQASGFVMVKVEQLGCVSGNAPLNLTSLKLVTVCEWTANDSTRIIAGF